MSSPIYTTVSIATPMTWNLEEFWVAFEIRECLGDSYDDGEGVVEYMGEANDGEHGVLGDYIRLLIALRVPFVMTQEPDLQGLGTISSFDGFQRLDAEWASEVVLSNSQLDQIYKGRHPWAGSARHYFQVANRFDAQQLVVDHLQELVPPDPRTRRNVLIMDIGLAGDQR